MTDGTPHLDCDIVMKGGITSGVIYPWAVCELAATYRLRAVGGASAGAIAAAAAAAAEYGRESDGFTKLAALPDTITATSPMGGSTLFRLFQPSKQAEGLLRLATAGLRPASDLATRSGGLVGFVRSAVARLRRSVAVRTIAVLFALLRCAPWTALLGAVPGVVVLSFGVAGTGPTAVAADVAGVVLVLVGVLGGSAAGTARRAGTVVSGEGFGLCSGMPGGRRFRRAQALTPWLHALLQDLAGRPGGDPLTFGDLSGEGCDLRVMTTNLTRKQPIALPFEAREYFFDPEKFRTLFPEEVVRWMEDHPPALDDQPEKRWSSEVLRSQALPLRPFPARDDLPVVVATRMSLSFPYLISAVPLHAVDYTRDASREASAAADRFRRDYPGVGPEDAAARLPERDMIVNWFSDGGICSNLPVHFFDRPLPRRPTFAIDLAPFPPGRMKSDDESQNSRLPTVNQGGFLRRTSTWPVTGLAGLLGFGAAIVSTARAWVDEGLTVTPGYRDRIVTVYCTDEEGGLNLTMSTEVVRALAERGQDAAQKLVARFAHPMPDDPATWGWRNQEWIRFRTATTGLDRWIAQFRDVLTDPTVPEPYSGLAGDGANDRIPSYRLTQGRRAVVNRRTDAIVALAEEWATSSADAFANGTPTPAPVLGLMPFERAEPPSDPAPDAVPSAQETDGTVRGRSSGE